MGTTNYTSTFIRVADDCPVEVAEPPPDKKTPTVASLQYALITENPYALTSDDVIFEVHATRKGIPDEDKPAAREEFFSKGQPCLRSSALAKRYGWGIHHDADNHVALVPLGSDEYTTLSDNPSTKQLKAMKSKR